MNDLYDSTKGPSDGNTYDIRKLPSNLSKSVGGVIFERQDWFDKLYSFRDRIAKMDLKTLFLSTYDRNKNIVDKYGNNKRKDHAIRLYDLLVKFHDNGFSNIESLIILDHKRLKYGNEDIDDVLKESVDRVNELRDTYLSMKKDEEMLKMMELLIKEMFFHSLE